MAATVFSAPQKAHYTVINGRVVAEKGRMTTVDLDRVVAQHNEESLKLASRVSS